MFYVKFIKPSFLFYALSTLTLLFLLPDTSSAQEWKFRAREHYELHDVSVGSDDYKFKGFANSINFWKEKAFDYSLGFSFSSLFSSPKLTGSPVADSPFGGNINLYSLGAEGKYFFKVQKMPGLFGRGGIGLSLLNSDGGLDELNGFNLYTGIGYEFYIFKNVSLAPELAYRYSKLEDDVSIISFTPSIGLHFYKDFL